MPGVAKPKRPDPSKNLLFYGDCLDVLGEWIDDESVDLIYLDPPFNSQRNYNVLFKQKSGGDGNAQITAFDDTWTWGPDDEIVYQNLQAAGGKVADVIAAMRELLGASDMMSYIVMMTPRLVELRRVLNPTGSLYLHCDPVASHYLKLVLDAIFGPLSFLNEVIWQRTATKGDAKRKFGAVHDVLLVYAKSAEHTFNAQFMDKDEAYVGRFALDDNDGRGPYRLAPLDSPNPRPNLTYEYKGYAPPTKGWRVKLSEMEKLDADGRLAFPKSATGRIAKKHYMAEQEGRKAADVWTDIRPLQGSGNERLGYPTQKPLALLNRIIEASSNPGDVVLDPFCGCGTAVDAAQRLGRRWIGMDISYLAVDLIETRMIDAHGPALTETFEVVGVPRDAEGALALFKRSPFDFERWAVSLVDGTPNEKQVGDKGVDGRIRFPLDAAGKTGRVIVSVKGGATVTPSMVRDLDSTVGTQGGQMGLLILNVDPSAGVLAAARDARSFVHPLTGQTYDKIQVVTVADLLAGKRPRMPAAFMPYLQAERFVPPHPTLPGLG